MRRALLAILLLSVPLPGHAQPTTGEVRGGERYSGFDVALLAEASARLSTLRTQHGEKAGDARFAEWLEGRGLSRRAYDSAYAAWWERFRADPTGQLEARFHRIDAEWSQQLNYADAPDRRREKREGVTLEQYARVSVALSRNPGGDIDAMLREHGIKSRAQWTRVNTAWGQAMKDDTTLVQQYGALYQKFAGPQQQAEMQAVTANALAANRSVPRPAGTPAVPTIDEYVAGLSADAPERWRSARFVALQCDLWLGPARKDPKDPRAAHCGREALEKRLLPVMLDALEHHDDGTVSYATGLLPFFAELGLKTPDARMSVQRALARKESHLRVLEESFAAIQDKAVPERVPLRTKLEETRQAVRELRQALATW